MLNERLTGEQKERINMYNFKLPEHIHGYRLPRTIDDIKKQRYIIVPRASYSTLTDEEASEILKRNNPKGLFRGFNVDNPDPITLRNLVYNWFQRKMEKEEGIDQRTFREMFGHLDVVVDPNDVKIISTIYDPHADQPLIAYIKKKELEYRTQKTYELKLKLDELKERFDAEPCEVKEAVIPAGTVVKINITVPEMIKIIIQHREQQLNREFGL